MLTKVLEASLEIRAFEHKLLDAYSKRHFGGTVHTCIGQEILPVVLSKLAPRDTFIFSNHRGHGHYLAHVCDYSGLFREFLGKVGAPSGGIGGSQHLFGDNFLSNGIQGNTSPFAVGVGLSKPTILYMGDGTFGEGTLYEAMNMAACLKSNILFVVEDNGISQTTPSSLVRAGSIRSKFEAFEIPVFEADSADVDSLLASVKECARFDAGPKALVVKSFRLMSHSKGDDTRSSKEIADLADPLIELAKRLSLDFDDCYKNAQARVSSVFDEVVAEQGASFRLKSLPTGNRFVPRKFEVAQDKDHRVNEVIRKAIAKELAENALFVGEDIVTRWKSEDQPYGGAFGVAFGLSDEFKNVIGTSISEAGIVGVGAGRAFATGKLSICEIMFADFSTLIVDQVVNGIDKFHKMFARELDIPLAIRIPYGMGRGYGPTHSQSPLELFGGLSEVRVISYTPLVDYSMLLKHLSGSGDSALIFEPKIYYGDRVRDWGDLLDTHKVSSLTDGSFIPSILVQSRTAAQVHVICHGSAAKPVLEYLKESQIGFELLIVSELSNSRAYEDWLLASDLPLVVLEEKNTEVGFLSGKVSMLISSNASKRNLFFNPPVENIPANLSWERELMISNEFVANLIMEAAL